MNFDIVCVEFFNANITGDLDTFGDGNRTLCLHFQYITFYVLFISSSKIVHDLPCFTEF